MNEPLEPMPLKTRLIRRLLPLAILASAAALVVIQMTQAVTQDVDLQIELSPGLPLDFSLIELQVIDEQEQVVSLTQFRFDQSHRPEKELTHTLKLTRGSYQLVFKVSSTEAPPLVIRRRLLVEGDALTRFRLP